MKRLIHIAALVTAITCVATGQWVYLVYIGAVVFAINSWRPSWRALTLPRASTEPHDLETAKYRRPHLLIACGLSTLLMGHAFKHVIVDGEGLIAAGLAMLLTLGLVVWILILNRQIWDGKLREDGVQ